MVKDTPSSAISCFDADTLDAIYLDGERLQHGLREKYILTFEGENEVWIENPDPEERWLIGIEDSTIDFRMYGDDLTINVFYEEFESLYFESILIKNFDMGDLGITLEDYDNRPQSLMSGGGGGEEQSLKVGDLFASLENSIHAWDREIERVQMGIDAGPNLAANFQQVDQMVHGDG